MHKPPHLASELDTAARNSASVAPAPAPPAPSSPPPPRCLQNADHVAPRYTLAARHRATRPSSSDSATAPRIPPAHATSPAHRRCDRGSARPPTEPRTPGPSTLTPCSSLRALAGAPDSSHRSWCVCV